MSKTPVSSLVLVTPVDEGLPTPAHFRVEQSEMDCSSLPPGAVLLRSLCYSADPYQRGSIRPESAAPGSVVRGFLAGVVEQSHNAAWAVGDHFGASLPLATLQIVGADALTRAAIWKLPGLTDATITRGVGVLGMPGSTAYGGLIDVLRPARGRKRKRLHSDAGPL